jgi:ubiquinone/menaquinone biosynthesis C-methylase UbiE
MDQKITNGLIMDLKANIYNDNSYISSHPNLHEEDSDFKFQQFIEMLEGVEVRDNRLKLLDVGGGAGVLGKMVFDYFDKKGVDVTMHALDLSSKMLEIQLLNNDNIEKVLNCTLEDCSENDYDLALMIDVIEHIPDNNSAAKALNKLSRHIIYNIPIEVNFFDFLRNILNKFTFYKEQTKVLGHLHFFSKIKALNFLKRHHSIIEYSFRPYCFMIRESQYDGYIQLKEGRLRRIENVISCWVSNYFKLISPLIIQGSLYASVKSSK